MTSDTFGKRLTAVSTAPDIQHLQKVRVGVVGCGAIAKLSHLPALAQCDAMELAALVDVDAERAAALAATYGSPSVLTDYRALKGRVDAAVVALPNHLHAPVSVYLLRHGIHVLVEKPMALNVRQCDEMIEAAARTHTVLTVGLDFRFFQACRFVKRLLSHHWLGEIKGFDLQQGVVTRWPVASDYPFHRETAAAAS
jgi:predicted dehydrogenase